MGKGMPAIRQKPREEQQYDKELIAIFTEHWNHARHCENERLWFTNIYAIVVAAILVFMGNAVYAEPPDYGSAFMLTLFGLILSIVGFMIVIALSLGYLHHIVDIVVVYYYWDKMEFYRHPKKPVRFATWHRYFFEITIALFSVFFLFYILQVKTLVHLVSLWILIVFFTEVIYHYAWGKKYALKCVNFMKKLRNDTKGEYRSFWPVKIEDLRKEVFGNQMD